MRFRIRRNHSVHPLVLRDSRAGFRLPRDEDEWTIRHAAPARELDEQPDEPPADDAPPVEEPAMTMPPPPPFSSSAANGLRAQATAGDARAERLIRAVRMEVADLKQAIDGWRDAREEMVEVDLDAVRADPEAAATLPPQALVRAINAANDRIAELERRIESHKSIESALREELARLNEEHSYTQGRLETLQDVISALHANLDDLRYERDRTRNRAAIEPASREALGGGDMSSGQLRGDTGTSGFLR